MKTTIDNNQRVFLIKRLGYFTREYFCNLSDIPNILKDELELSDEYKIFEFWNTKLRSCSKKHLNDMFKANQINFKIQ
jgi:hypothetical protein